MPWTKNQYRWYPQCPYNFCRGDCDNSHKVGENLSLWLSLLIFVIFVCLAECHKMINFHNVWKQSVLANVSNFGSSCKCSSLINCQGNLVPLLLSISYVIEITITTMYYNETKTTQLHLHSKHCQTEYRQSMIKKGWCKFNERGQSKNNSGRAVRNLTSWIREREQRHLTSMWSTKPGWLHWRIVRLMTYILTMRSTRCQWYISLRWRLDS